MRSDGIQLCVPHGSSMRNIHCQVGSTLLTLMWYKMSCASLMDEGLAKFASFTKIGDWYGLRRMLWNLHGSFKFCKQFR